MAARVRGMHAHVAIAQVALGEAALGVLLQLGEELLTIPRQLDAACRCTRRTPPRSSHARERGGVARCCTRCIASSVADRRCRRVNDAAPAQLRAAPGCGGGGGIEQAAGRPMRAR